LFAAPMLHSRATRQLVTYYVRLRTRDSLK
jgi:hypothetical protein